MPDTVRRISALVALALPVSAGAAKVPATVNIGIGPTIGTVWVRSMAGPPPVSVGVALRAEGWVSKKTLQSKKVMRRVPRKYKGMVRSMDDMHVVPLPVALLPDQALVVPVGGEADEPSVRAVGWTPISLYLSHAVQPVHASIGAAPRVGWVQVDGDPSDDLDPTHHAWLGLDLNPELESAMRRIVGVAVGGNVGPGLVVGDPAAQSGGASVGLWADAYLRVQVRKPIKVSI